MKGVMCWGDKIDINKGALDRYITGNWGEDSVYSDPCEDCEMYCEELEDCGIVDIKRNTDGYVNMDFCPKVSMIEKCAVCKAPINKLIGSIPKDCIGITIYENIYCCTKECADKSRKEAQEEVERMKDGWREGDLCD